MPKIILITHQKGGVGKSTLTFNLATNIKDSARVAIIDMDSQGSLSQIADLAKVDILSADNIKNITSLNYDFVFIDTPPYLIENLKELCSIANLIIIPTKAGVLDLFAIRSTLEIIKASKNEKKALIVLNMIKHNSTLTDDIVKELSELNIKVAKTMISDLVAFSRSVLVDGVTDNNNAQKQIDSLTKEVLTSII